MIDFATIQSFRNEYLFFVSVVVPIRLRLLRLRSFIRTTLIQLNVFGGVIPSLDLHEIQSERVATRIYILVLTFTVLPLLLVNLLIVRLRMITVESPSEATFERLQSLYGTSLQCPCSIIARPYDEFIVDFTSIHSICDSSDFISPKWFSQFPVSIQSHFKILKSFCSRSYINIVLSITGFTSSQFITRQALPRDLITAQVLALHRQLQSRTKTRP